MKKENKARKKAFFLQNSGNDQLSPENERLKHISNIYIYIFNQINSVCTLLLKHIYIYFSCYRTNCVNHGCFRVIKR